jgi:4'-phosphopantetheinyl transferase
MIPATSQYDTRNLWSVRSRTRSRSPISYACANEWLSAPKSVETSESEAHIWKIDLTSDSPGVDSSLSGEEHVRAARFHFEVDRRRFKIARGALRVILSRYLLCSPQELQFGQTTYGKPFLKHPHDETLSFNLSHAGEMALLAVTRAREVGIDVEFMRPDFATDEVAENFFSPFEVAELQRVEPNQRTQAFFNCWTRKEAYVKARGEGLSMPLNLFDVTLAPHSVATMLSNRRDKSETSRWTFHDIALNENYVGALVIETTEAPLHISRFQFCK